MNKVKMNRIGCKLVAFNQVTKSARGLNEAGFDALCLIERCPSYGRFFRSFPSMIWLNKAVIRTPYGVCIQGCAL